VSDSRPEIPEIAEYANKLSRQERFMATVYAMNTLLMEKQVYSKDEFAACFIEWAKKEIKNRPKQSC